MIKRLFVFLTFLAAAYSCSNSSEYVPDVKVGGEAAHDQTGFLTISKALLPIDIARGVTSGADTITIDTNWFFLKSFDYVEGIYIIQYNESSLWAYLTPGKSLNINFEAIDPFGTRKFSSSSKKPTRFLNYRIEILSEIDERKLYKYQENIFLQKLDSCRKTLDTLIVDFITDKPTFNRTFFEDYSLRNYYFTTAHLMRYAQQRHYYSDTLKPLSESYFNFIKSFNFNDTLALRGVDYILTIQLIMEHELEELLITESTTAQEQVSAKLNWIDSTIQPGLVKDFFYTSTLKNYIVFDFHHEADSIIKMGAQQIQDSALLASLKQELHSRSHLKRGGTVPNFSFLDSANKTVTLEDFKGKFVYLDFWATWCGPCLEQLPSLKQLERKHSKDDVAILSINLDESRTKWMQFITEQALTENQLYATKSWQSDVADFFVIKAIPRYILLDKQGKIIDANAPNPAANPFKNLID